MTIRKKGFTVFELIVVIFFLALLMFLLYVPGRALITRLTARSRAGVDAANLRTVYMQVEKKLISDKSMNEITKNIAPVKCQLAPGAKLWVNHSKDVTLEVYFVDGDDFYSMDYLTEVAVSGHSYLPLKKPFTLGFWYELGTGKVNEYIPRK